VSLCLSVFVFIFCAQARFDKHEDTKTERHEENIINS